MLALKARLSPDAPLIPNGRAISAQVQFSAFVRREPDTVRARPPTSNFDTSTLPAYLRPPTPPRDVGKAQPPPAKDAKAADKSGKDKQDQDQKDRKDKDKKDKAAKDKKEGGAGHAADAAGGDGTHGGAAKDKKGGGGREERVEKGDAESAPDLEAAIPESGSVELERDLLRVSDPSNAYDGPTELTVRPKARAGGPKPKPDPDIDRYVSVFAEAAAAARRLHDALIADAMAAADAARAAASASADRRQSELDASLQALDDGLDDARQQLTSLTDDAESLVIQRAAEAEQAIRQAARAAKGALAAATANVTRRKAGAEVQRAGAEVMAKVYQGMVEAAGKQAGQSLQALKDNPQGVFPDPGGAMPNAINEATITRAPIRADHRIHAFEDELKAQTAAMSASYGRLPDAFKAKFQEVDSWIEKTSKHGPAAVDHASASSLKQLATMRQHMLAAIHTGHDRTEAALVRQHNAARKQTIIAHKARAKSEAAVESRRSEQDITGLRALGIAQGAAARVLSDGFAKETDRDEKAFAKAVVTASRGFMGRVAATETGQRPRLVASAANNRDVTERQSRSSGEGLIHSSDAVAEQIGAAARESGDALYAQANDVSSGYAKLAEPVSKSIQSFLPPVGKAFEDMITRLNTAVDETAKTVTAYYTTGKSGEKSGGQTGADGGQTGATPSAGDQAKAPKMAPQKYAELGFKVGGDAKTDTQIADLDKKAHAEIPKKIDDKAAAVWTNIGAFHVNTEGVLSALRSITQRQGAAIKEDFQATYGQPIEPFIRYNMPKTFSTYTTNKNNVDAAINYLNGNAVEGALNELKAAVNWSNENARVEAVARSLTPAQWAALKEKHPEDVKDIREDLDTVNQDIFKALETEGDIAAGKAQSLSTDPTIISQPGEGVAKANALRLRQQIDEAREKRGDAGADAAADKVETAALNAGQDVISGGDAIKELEEHPIDAIDTADPSAERNKQQWDKTKKAFDQLEGGKREAPKVAQAGWSIAAYAAQKKDYTVYVEDRGYDEYGERYGHYETKTEGISDNQQRLIQNIVQYGPDSEEAAAARVMVEMGRDGGKPKPERLDKAMHLTSLDAKEGEDKSKLDPEEKKRRFAEARDRQRRILGLVGQYQHPDVYGPADPEAVRKDVEGKLTAAQTGDKSAQELTKRTMRGLSDKDTWESEQIQRHEDAKAAFDYALDHEGERGDTLKRTFGRMDRQEINDSVDEWNKAHPGQDPLYKQLNLFGKGSWWTEKLSGDERNDVELAAMGVARNPKERAEIGRWRAEQQIRDAGFLGKFAGTITGDWTRLKQSRDKVEELMGLDHGSFDEFGQAIGDGHFDEKGQYKPPHPGAEAELERAMNMTHLTAESYKVMTDSLATAVTTALVVIAAVVTTVLTGGAAASIWIPVLVTAAAGLTGMALSAAIKGNRYSRAEMERDLVMTFVQAATAGLGAAAGVAMKGGMPALRAVATEMVVSEKALEGIAKVAGTQALSKGWTLVAEMGVAAGSNAINSAAGAAMDPTNRARGQSGEKAFDAGLKGLFSGALGGLIMKPAGALGGRVGGSYGQRVLGNVASGVGQRAAEIGYDRATGERRMEGYEIGEELKSAAVQSVVQSSLEEGGAHYGDARRARTAQAAAARGGRPPPGELEAPGRRPPTETERRAAPPEERPGAARQPPEAEPGAARPTAREPPIEPAARAPPPEPIVLPLPSDLAPVVGVAKDLRPPELPPVAASPTETPARPPEPPAPAAPAPAAPAGGRASDKEAVAPRTSGRPADEDGPTTQRMIRPGHAAETPATARGPRVIEGAEALEGGVMILPNSTSRAEIDEVYHRTLREDPTREVAIYRNPETGEHILVFGNADKAYIGPFPKLGEAPHAAESPALRQEWKEILPADVGRWELQAHYHPGAAGQHDVAPMWRRIPSSGEQAGDFLALQRESEAAGGQPRASVIHYRDGERTGYTIFGHQPPDAPFWINVENPNTGARETHVFPDQKKYEEWAATHGARPNVDHTVAGGPSATPFGGGPRRDEATTPAEGGPSGPTPASAAPRPDESFTIRHGTSEDAARRIAKTGIDPHHSTGTVDDFSRGFYTTLDEPSATEYAIRGREQRDRINKRTPGDHGAIVEINVKLSELGKVVDVRPGGEHNAAWEEFLERKPPPSPPVPKFPPAWDTAREYGLNRGRLALKEMERGTVFEAFLKEKGLGDADVIRGTLGDPNWTGGIQGKQPGEQIVIRSRKIANVLNERMGYPAIPEEPVPPGARRAAPQEPPQGHDHPSLRNEPDPFPLDKFPGFEEPIRKFRAPPSEEEKAAFKAEQRAIDEQGIQDFMAVRPEEGAKLKALLDLAPDVVMHAIRGDEPAPAYREAARLDAALRQETGEAGGRGRLPSASEAHVQALVAELTARGMPAEEIKGHAEALRGLLKTASERLAEYRDYVMKGTLPEVPSVAKARENLKNIKGKQKRISVDEAKAQAVVDFSDALAARDPTTGAWKEAGVREFIGAARERAAWQAAAVGLDAEARAALTRQIDVEAIEDFRGLGKTVGTYKDRDALKQLDAVDKGLATDVLAKITGDPTQHPALLAEWETARLAKKADPAAVAEELKQLGTVLTEGNVAKRLLEARQTQADLKVSSMDVGKMALEDPVLLQLALTNREAFIDRYVSMMRRKRPPGQTLGAAEFRADVEMNISADALSRASEAAATWNVARGDPNVDPAMRREWGIIKSKSTSSAGRTNKPGIDIAAFAPRTEEQRLAGEPVPVHLFDDKAERKVKLGKVSALTENLVENLRDAIKEPRKTIAALEAEGKPVDPDFRAALDQMEKAAHRIATEIDPSKLPHKGGPGSGNEPYQRVEYAREVARILKEEGITLHITSEYGQIMTLADWIKAYGFQLWDQQPNNTPGVSAATLPPPPPPPPPPPGP